MKAFTSAASGGRVSSAAEVVSKTDEFTSCCFSNPGEQNFGADLLADVGAQRLRAESSLWVTLDAPRADRAAWLVAESSSIKVDIATLNHSGASDDAVEEGEDSEGGSGEGGEREEGKIGPNIELASVCEDGRRPRPERARREGLCPRCDMIKVTLMMTLMSKPQKKGRSTQTKKNGCCC